MTPERSALFDNLELAEQVERKAESDFNDKTEAARAATEALATSEKWYLESVADTDAAFKALRSPA